MRRFLLLNSTAEGYYADVVRLQNFLKQRGYFDIGPALPYDSALRLHMLRKLASRRLDKPKKKVSGDDKIIFISTFSIASKSLQLHNEWRQLVFSLASGSLT